MNNHHKNIFAYVFMCIFLVGVSYYVFTHWQQFERFSDVSGLWVALLFASGLLSLLAQGLVLKIAISPFAKLTFLEWFGVKVVQLAGNYIVPFGGVGFRIHYIQKRHNVSISDILTTFVVVMIMQFFLFSIGGAVGVLVAYQYTAEIHALPIAVLGGGAVTLGAILICSPKIRLPWQCFPFPQLNRVLNSWRTMCAYRSFMWKAFFFIFIQYLAMALPFYCAFRAFGFELSYTCALLVTCLSTYSMNFRIAPAALGTYEAAIIYSLSIYGQEAPEALVVIGLVRVVNVIEYFLLSSLFSWFLMANLRELPCQQYGKEVGGTDEPSPPDTNYEPKAACVDDA